MAIIVPAAGAEISAADFGNPVATQLNELAQWRAAFTRGQGQLGVGGTFNSGQSMGTIAIPASTYRRRILCVLHLYIGFSAATDVQMMLNGNPVLVYRTGGAAGAGTATLDMVQPIYDAAPNTAYTLGASVSGAGSVTTYNDAFFNQAFWSAVPI